MIKAGKDLIPWGEKFLHITCLCHLLHRVCEVIRHEFSRANLLIRQAFKRVSSHLVFPLFSISLSLGENLNVNSVLSK